MLLLIFIALFGIYMSLWLIRGKPMVMPWQINWDRFGKHVGWICLVVCLLAVIFILIHMIDAMLMSFVHG